MRPCVVTSMQVVLEELPEELANLLLIDGGDVHAAHLDSNTPELLARVSAAISPYNSARSPKLRSDEGIPQVGHTLMRTGEYMNSQEFVSALKKYVGEVAVQSVLKNLELPPGRKPRAELLEMSRWFLALPSDDQAMVMRVVEEAVRNTIFGMLAVLDGAGKINDSSGEFILHHKGVAGDSILNGPQGPSLHELLYW